MTGLRPPQVFTPNPRFGSDDRAGLVDDVFSIARSIVRHPEIELQTMALPPPPHTQTYLHECRSRIPNVAPECQVVDDSTSPLASYAIPLSYALQLVNETAAAVWSPVIGHLGAIDRMLGGQGKACRRASSALLLRVIDKQVMRLGIKPAEGETHLTSLLRSTLVSTAVTYGLNEIVRAARILYDNESVVAFGPEEAALVYTAVVRWGGVADFEAMQERYLLATFAAEKKRFMYALAATRAPALLDRVLRMAISPDVRSQDTVSLIAAVAGYPEGRAKAWQFLKANWGLLDRRYGAGGFALTRLVLTASHFFSDIELDDVTQFFQTHPVPAAERAVSRVLEEIAGASTWVTARAEVVVRCSK